MGRLKILRFSPTKKGVHASPLSIPPKKARVEESNLDGQSPLLKGPSSNLPPTSHTNVEGTCRKGKGVDFNSIAKQPVKRGMPIHSFVQAPILYETFLTGGLSQRIEEDRRLDLRHTLVRHALMTIRLAYKDMLESEENDAKKREMCDELMKARKELTVGAGKKKQLAINLKESQTRGRALELELKEYTAKMNELLANIERARSELALSQGLLKKLKEELAKKDEELAQKNKS
ncbi:hypothetical protein ACOSQ3_004859 [Xanthoceras sorbifolium]